MTTVISGSNPSITFSDSTTQNTSPFSTSTFGFKNRIINGGMTIDQRNAGANVTVSSSTVTYTLDRYFAYATQASKFTVQQLSASPPVGFTNYLGVTSSSAYSIGIGDFFFLSQRIEGSNVSDLAWGTANAKTITVSFQVYSSLTGTFGGALRNSSATRSYPFTYTISTANTWTTITITIAGDTTGTWLTTNGIGIDIDFSLGTGTSYSATSGTWATGNYLSATGAVSVVGTSGATWYVTGVQLEVGTQATSFDYRDYGSELILCQRYYQKITNGVTDRGLGVGFWYNSTTMVAQIAFQVNMRSSPTLDVNSGSNYFILYSNSAGTPMNTVTLNDATPYTGAVTQNSLSGTSGSAGQFKSNNVSSSLAFTAEL